MLILNLIINLTTLIAVFGASRMRYLSTERPEVTWFNPKYFEYVNISAQRYSRADPQYYIGFNIDLIWPVHNNINVDFYFYELVANQYKRSFLELHFTVCDMFVKEIFFGFSFGAIFPYKCPLQPGIYHIENVTVPLKKIPEMVPFNKGRVKANFTSNSHEFLGYGHIDIEIKESTTRRMKN